MRLTRRQIQKGLKLWNRISSHHYTGNKNMSEKRVEIMRIIDKHSKLMLKFSLHKYLAGRRFCEGKPTTRHTHICLENNLSY